MRSCILSCLLWSALLLPVLSFSPQDHEIFRLRDEIAATEGRDVTFYTFLSLPPTASQDEISKAYRKKSRLLHPDKVKQSLIAARAKQTNKPKVPLGKKPKVHVNKPPSEAEINKAVKKASERYARMSSVQNILKGSGRERYDFFLANGFPAWRGTGYYYARYRPGLGTVLVGLFIFAGGVVHYAAMYLGWQRQRQFVERYIRHARRAAWGDETGIQGIPGLDASASPPPTAEQTQARENGQAVLNRRQKRAQEKEAKKEKKSGKKGIEEQTEPEVPTAPQGAKKRVQAENGKILIVDSMGNVFLEEENEDGEVQEFRLDPEDVPRPTYKDTVLVRLPKWIYGMVQSRLAGQGDANEVKSGYGVSTEVNGSSKKRGKKLAGKGS